MQKVLLISAIVLLSQPVFADDTTTETCANGAGIVITGAVSKHKYCKSNTTMSWWNAHAWCDSQGRRLFSLEDCEYSATGTTACADLRGIGGGWGWTATPKRVDSAYSTELSSGGVDYNVYTGRTHANYALCY